MVSANGDASTPAFPRERGGSIPGACGAEPTTKTATIVPMTLLRSATRDPAAAWKRRVARSIAGELVESGCEESRGMGAKGEAGRRQRGAAKRILRGHG